MHEGEREGTKEQRVKRQGNGNIGHMKTRGVKELDC